MLFLICFRGLLGGHVMATYFKRKRRAMEWYNGELLMMAKDVGFRLLPAFNTTTGIPYPRVCAISCLQKQVMNTRKCSVLNNKLFSQDYSPDQ